MYFIAALTDLPPEATKGVLIDAQLISPSGMVAEDPLAQLGRAVKRLASLPR